MGAEGDDMVVLIGIFLGAACLLGALVGVVLVIVGLVKRRRGVWIGGLAVLVLAGLALAALGIWAGYVAYRKTAQVAIDVATEVSAVAEGSDAKMRQWFRWSTGVDLPADAEYVGGCRPTLLRSVYYLKFKVKPDFRALLDAHFSKAEWSEVRDSLMPPRDWDASLPFWDIARREGSTVRRGYRRTFKDVAGATFNSILAWEEETGLVYFVALEE